jgi:PAS domain S-box-containing protein
VIASIWIASERERYQALFEFAPVAYLVTDPVARILEANRAAAALLDVDQRFLVGKPLAAYVASEDRGVLRRLRWLLQSLALSGWERFVADDERAVERDDARKQHLEALAELDPAADLDGTVQVLLDAGVRLLDVDGVGLMLVDGHGRLYAAGGSNEASLAFLRAQEHLIKGPCWHALCLDLGCLARVGRPSPAHNRAVAPARSLLRRLSIDPS